MILAGAVYMQGDRLTRSLDQVSMESTKQVAAMGQLSHSLDDLSRQLRRLDAVYPTSFDMLRDAPLGSDLDAGDGVFIPASTAR